MDKMRNRDLIWEKNRFIFFNFKNKFRLFWWQRRRSSNFAIVSEMKKKIYNLSFRNARRHHQTFFVGTFFPIYRFLLLLPVNRNKVWPSKVYQKKYDPEELVVHTVHTFKPENEEAF